MRILRLSRVAAAGLCLGCAAGQKRSLLAWKKPDADGSPPKVADPEYRVGVGDRLMVERVGATNPENVDVRGDGSIELRDGASVRVDSLTVAEVANQLSKDGSKVANVAVGRYNSQFVNVYGLDNAERATTVPYRGSESLSGLLSRVGCRQWRSGAIVKLVRPAPSLGTPPQVHTFRYGEHLELRDGQRELGILPNDYIYVERDRGQPATVAEENHRRRASPWNRLFGKDEPRAVAKADR